MNLPNNHARVPTRRILMKALLLSLACSSALRAEPSDSAAEQTDPPEVLLGERLFMEERFSSPDGDRAISCRTCHLVDEEAESRGMRAYVDYEERSRVPIRDHDHYNQELRNSPTMVDSVLMPFLHWDGEFTSLEQLTRTTLSGRNMGWLKGEEEKAFAQAQRILLEDEGIAANAESGIAAVAPYRTQFKEVYGVDLKALTRDECVEWIAKSMSDYMRSLRRRNDSPYDKFVTLNGLEEGPAAGEDPRLFAQRHLRRIAQREHAGTLQLPEKFPQEALHGMKIFFGIGGNHSGNCATCHVPPAFTDFSFHNVGISQLEFDRMHGEGSFAEMPIPSAREAKRPDDNFLGIPSGREPNAMDLGFWNRVNIKTSDLRRADENEDEFLNRMIGTFKTPTLRNLKFTDPYMHNGAFPTIERALEEIRTASDLARAGRIRSGDTELGGIRLGPEDIAPLTAFLETLNETYD